MITAVALLLFIVFLTLKSIREKEEPSKPFYYRYRKVLSLLGITLIPVLYMNMFHQQARSLSVDEYFEYTVEEKEEYSQIEAYIMMMDKYPDSTPLRFGYIDLLMGFTHDYELLENKYSPNQIVQRQSLSYARAKHFINDTTSWQYISLPKKSSRVRFDNYILAIASKATQKYDSTKIYLLAEIEINPEFDDSYLELIELCRYKFPDEFNKYSLDPKYASHLPFYTQRFNYFWHNDFYNYFKVITIKTFTNLKMMPFLAALLISIVWMIFMRSMDVYHKEKWRDIIIVFILGGIFTHFCLFGYDYSRYVYEFTLNGEAWNDFWYCVIVIGGSEEIVKLIPWLLFIFLARKAKEPYDYLLYASVSALGFAFVENFSYLENPGNIVIRSIMSTVGHMFDASVIAYAFILARYRAKNIVMKIAWPFIGFALACLCHGFYDFWLISPSVSGYWVLTMIFFVITLHIWFLLHNNAINNSPFYTKLKFNSDVQLNLIVFGIIGIMMVEYIIIGYRYGADDANRVIGRNGWMAVVFLSYMTAILANMKIVPGRWKKYKLVMPSGMGRFFNIPAPERFRVEHEESYVGLNLKLFVQKSNRYVGDKFPVSGICADPIELSGSEGWYIFHLNNPISYTGFGGDQVIIRVKNKEDRLDEDKVEIILLFVPVGTYLSGSNLRVEDFRFTGKAFARPV